MRCRAAIWPCYSSVHWMGSSKKENGGGWERRDRERRSLAGNSRHIPVAVARFVRERDGNQCTFVDDEGRRCSARRFLTFEHRQPYALGGAATAENLCLLCASHNAHAARRLFGEAYIAPKCRGARQRCDGS